MYTCTYTYIYTHTHTGCLGALPHRSTHVDFAHTYMYTYIHTCTYTYIHNTHIHTAGYLGPLPRRSTHVDYAQLGLRNAEVLPHDEGMFTYLFMCMYFSISARAYVHMRAWYTKFESVKFDCV